MNLAKKIFKTLLIIFFILVILVSLFLWDAGIISKKSAYERSDLLNDLKSLEIKAALYDKYKPTICVSMSSVSSDFQEYSVEAAATKFKTDEPDKYAFISKRYNISLDQRIYDVYSAINKVRAWKTWLGYKFYYENNKCCILRDYQGRLIFSNSKIFVIYKMLVGDKNIPC